MVKAYCGLQDREICGFNHDDLSKYASYSSYDFKLPLAQYRWKRLSNDFTLATIQYEGSESSMSIEGDSMWTPSVTLDEGICHGIAFWIEYDLNVSGSMKDKASVLKLTTGNRYNE